MSSPVNNVPSLSFTAVSLEKRQSDTRGVSHNTAQDAGHGDEGCQEKDESKREN